MSLAAWLDRHTAAAPPVLRGRVHEHARAFPSEGPTPVVLAGAAHRALDRVLSHPGDRSVALDLLAADALITLALLAQAQESPADLGRFAASLVQAARPST